MTEELQSFNFSDIGKYLDLAKQIMPLMPRINKAVTTIQKLKTDPDITDALNVASEVSEILAKSGIQV